MAGSTKLNIAAETKKLVEIRKKLNSSYEELLKVPDYHRSEFNDVAGAIDDVNDAVQKLTTFLRFANSQRRL